MQKTPSHDQELNLKKRARRRLVGAIALVLLMVIVLPMILKDRSATNPQDQVTITLPNEQAESEQAQAEASDFDSSVVPAEPSATALPEVTESEIEAAASKIQPVAKPAAAQTAAVKPALPKAATASPTPSVKSSTDANRQYHVQIGVFSDAANVKQLQSKLSDLGYKSQTEKIDTDKGKKIRLKTQVFADRNEAAIALENIKDAGLTGMVVSQ